MSHPSKTIVSVLAIICIILNSGFLGELLSTHPVSASGSLSSWNPRVSCVPVVVKITDITANSTGTTSYNTSPYSPGLTSPMGLAKRWLTSGATPPGWVPPGPPCTIKDSQGKVISIFVEIDHVRITSTYLTETDCSSTFDTVNGAGGYTTGGTKCDVTANLYSSPTNVCTSATDPGCWYKIHTEFDKDWQGAGYCGSSTVCDPSQAQSQLVAQSTYVDVQGFVYWDPDHLTTQWHSFSGWELHPLTAWRLSNGVQGLASAFTFSPANPGVNQPVTFTASVSGGSPPYSLKWNFGDGIGGTGSPVSHAFSAPGSYTVTLTVSDATGSTSTTSKIVPVSGPPDYTISLNPTSLIVTVGGSGTSTVTLKSLNGFTGTVSLAATISPSGPTASFSSTSLSLSSGGTSTSTLTIQAPTTLAPGNYTVTVGATNGTLAHSAILLINAKAVPDFNMLTNPSSITMLQGASGSSIVTLTSLNGFSGSVSLSATISASGFGVQINPNNPTMNSGGTSTSTLTITSPNNAVPDKYNITLTGKSGSIVHSVILPLAVTGFALAISPGDVSFVAGKSGSFNVTLVSLNGFSGNITLTDQVSNNHLFASLGSTIVNIPSGGIAVSVLTVSSSANGGYSVTVTGTSGNLPKKVSATVDVTTGPDFIISANPIFLDITKGSSGASTITATGVNGLTGNMNLRVGINPSGPLVSLSPTSTGISPGSSSTSTLTVSVPNSVAAGLYSIVVTGKSGPTHTVTLWLFVTRTLPDFTISPNPSSQIVAAGSSASYLLTLTSLNSFSGNITLSTNSRSGLTSSLNPALVTLSLASSATSNLTITTSSSTSPATYSITIIATSGSLVHATTVTIVVNGPADFALTGSPSALTILAGTSGSAAVGLNNYNGFSDTVNLVSGISPTTGLNCALNPTTISGSQTSTLYCNGTAGNYVVTVTGTSGSMSRSVNVTFTVQDFTISASPATVNLTAGGSGNSTITITSLQGFNSIVGLTSTSSSTSIRANLNPTSIPGSGTSTLTVSGSIPGTYTVNVTGTSNSLSHSVIVNVNVNPIQDFTMSARPASVTDDAHSPGVSNITVTSVNGFTGTIALSQNGGASCSLSASSVTLTVTTTTGSVALSCTFASAGNNNVTVTGNSGTISHSTTLNFTVQDFTVSANPTSMSATVNHAGTSSITVTALQGFTGIVNLATNSSSCTIAPNSVTGSGSATLSCTFSSAGIVHVVVTGTSGSLSHSVTVTFDVSPPASFSLSASPTSVAILAGATGTSTINVTASGGFAGTVSITALVSPSTGLTCSLSPSSVALSSTTTSGTSALSCSGSQGLYTVTVTGTSGTSQASTQVTFTVQDFTITGNPLSVGFSPGGTGSSTINIAGLQGFNGVVDLTASVSSPSINANLNPTSVTGSGKSTLTVSGSTTGTYSVTVTGTSSSLSHSVTITVSVGGSQDFQISTNPTSIILYPGGTNASIVSITPMNGFTGNVTLSATVPSGFSALFSNNPVAAGSTSTLSVSAASNVAVGSYTVTINGTSGSLTHSVSLSVRVLAKPAIAFVADVPVAGGSSNTATTSAMTFTKGDLIVVYVTVGAGQTVSFITDSGSPSSTYTQRASAVNGNTILYLYTATAATSTNNTMTVTVSAAGYLAISAAEYSGVVGFGALNTSTGTSTTPTVSLTTQNANSWVLVVYGWTGSGTHSANTGFNDRHAGSYGTQHLDYGDTNAAKPAGTYTYSGTLSLSDPWAMIALELV